MKKVYDDDDGRTIADMSGLERRAVIIPHIGGFGNRDRREEPQVTQENIIADPGEQINVKPVHRMDDHIDRKENRAAIAGALTAGLLIAGAIIVGLAIVVLIFTSFGK